jgi:dATP pyrophosphohydrolase
VTGRPLKIPESVLVVVYTSGLDVLLLERADQPGFWQSVTGSKDSLSEPLATVARREVAEETGIEVGSQTVPPESLQDWGMSHVYDIFPIWRHRYAPGVTQNTEHVFGLLVPRDVKISLAPREHLQYRWMRWNDAARECFSPSNSQAILQLPHR